MIKEVEQWKHEYKVLDACCELAQGKIAELKQDIEAYKRSEQEATEIIAELKAENNNLRAIRDGLLKIYDALVKNCNEYNQVLQEIKEIAEPFAKCYTHTCRNCEKYDSAHACCLKDIHCYKYNDGSKSSCKDFVLPTKQFYQQILANVITKITKAEEE